MTTDNTPNNEEDDLFNFDDLDANSKQRAAAAKASAAPPAGFVAPQTAPAAADSAPPPSASAVRAMPAQVAAASNNAPGQLPLVLPVTAKIPEPPASENTAPRQPISRGRRRPAAFTLAALAAATLVNLTLVGVVWRSMSGMDHALREVGDRVAHANEPAGDQVSSPPSAWQDLSILTPGADEGERALATAAEEIRQGEYERARARLYSLLCVLDRFDAKLRANFASRAQVLAADAFKEQADATEREALVVEAPGFLDVPAEKDP